MTYILGWSYLIVNVGKPNSIKIIDQKPILSMWDSSPVPCNENYDNPPRSTILASMSNWLYTNTRLVPDEHCYANYLCHSIATSKDTDIAVFVSSTWASGSQSMVICHGYHFNVQNLNSTSKV